MALFHPMSIQSREREGDRGDGSRSGVARAFGPTLSEVGRIVPVSHYGRAWQLGRAFPDRRRLGRDTSPHPLVLLT